MEGYFSVQGHINSKGAGEHLRAFPAGDVQFAHGSNATNARNACHSNKQLTLQPRRVLCKMVFQRSRVGQGH